MPHRFYCPQLPHDGLAQLDEAEAHHLIHVLRHSVDDVVELFNGHGLSAQCRVATIRKRDVTLAVFQATHDAPIARTLVLATCIPKGDRVDWLVEKASELGVSRLIPMTTKHSVVDPRSSKLDKLRNTVITACKQSGRNTLLEIDPVTSYVDLLRTIDREAVSLIAHPSGQSLTDVLASSGSTRSQELVFIGPEGGFSDEEIAAALAAGVISINLGLTILRTETAAIAVAARLLL